MASENSPKIICNSKKDNAMFKKVTGESGQIIIVPSLLRQELRILLHPVNKEFVEEADVEPDLEELKDGESDGYDFILGDSEQLWDRVILEQHEEEEEASRAVKELIKQKSESDSKLKMCSTNSDETKSQKSENFNCFDCAKNFKRSINLLKHVARLHGPNEKIPCLDCDKHFRNKTSLTFHVRFVHQRKTWKLWPNQVCLLKHIKMRHPTEIKKCPTCVKKFEKKIDVKRHIQDFHQIDTSSPDKSNDTLKCRHCEFTTSKKSQRVTKRLKTFACQLCGKMFARKSNLRCHTISQHEENVDDEEKNKFKFSCKICAELCLSKNALTRHMSGKHGVDTKQRKKYLAAIIKCLSCDYTTPRSSMTMHVRASHSKIENNVCEFCGKSFSAKQSLHLHIVRQHEINMIADDGGRKFFFLCRMCPELCPSKEELISHMTDMHKISKMQILRSYVGRAQDIVCNVCCKRFRSKGSFSGHFISQHEWDAKVDKDGKSTFSCFMCTELSLPRNELTCHMIEKHGVNVQQILKSLERIKCLQCDTLVARRSMQSHVRFIHDKIRKIVCSFCGETFTKTGHLREHNACYHEGEIIVDDEGKRIFPCDLCGQVCRTRWQFSMHRNTKHEKDAEKLGDAISLRILRCEKCRKCYTSKEGMSKHISNKHGGNKDDTGRSKLGLNKQQIGLEGREGANEKEEEEHL